MIVRRKSATDLTVKMSVRDIGVDVASAALPIGVAVVFGSQVQAAGGQCGEVSFTVPTCTSSTPGSLKCQQG